MLSGPDGFAILNFRRDVSVQAYRGGEPDELEGDRTGGVAVNDFRLSMEDPSGVDLS